MVPGRIPHLTRRLLIRPGAIGDFILSLPALQSLQATYTELWCAEQNVPLARFADHARSITSAGLDRLGHLPADDVLHRLAAFDEIHSWYGTALPEFRAHVSHLPFTFYSALPLATSSRQLPLHATAFYCRQVNTPTTLPRLSVPPLPSQNLIVIHPFASQPAKRWPLSYFETLAHSLSDPGHSPHPPPSIAWCAGPQEPLDRAVRIPGLFDLACWLSTARLFIGNDSGITHLAAALGIPVIALFGPTDPAIWAPLGLRVRVLAQPHMQDILPHHVLQLAQNLL